MFDQDVTVESQAGTAYISKEFISSKNSTPYPSRIGDPESGTVLFISSTLDSPNRSETLESEHDAKDLVEGLVNLDNKAGYSVEAVTPSAPSTTYAVDNEQGSKCFPSFRERRIRCKLSIISTSTTS